MITDVSVVLLYRSSALSTRKLVTLSVMTATKVWKEFGHRHLLPSKVKVSTLPITLNSKAPPTDIGGAYLCDQVERV